MTRKIAVTLSESEGSSEAEFTFKIRVYAVLNASAYGLSALGERVFQEGKLYGIQVLGDEVRVTTAAATGPDAKDAAAHRERVEHLWMERFDGERGEFIAQRGLGLPR